MNANRHFPACFARFAWYVLVCCIVPNAARAGDVAQNFAVVEKILPTAQGAMPLDAKVEGRFETAVPGSPKTLPLSFSRTVLLLERPTNR